MKAIEKSIIAAIIMAFKKVPMPGFCPKKDPKRLILDKAKLKML